jgi:NADPH-dependent curcumin reductase CurA
VGSCACQVAKNLGARVIGIAGGAAKVDYLLNEIGCDAAVDYKAPDLADQLAEAAPDGVDVFFDNVGGDILDAVLLQINERARVIICGAVSQYERTGDVQGPTNYLKIPEKNASMLGFTVMRFAEDYPEIQAAITEWVLSGQLKLPEQVESGIDQFPRALTLLFSGGHMGKLLVAP